MAVRRLNLNEEKTKLMIFTSKHHLKVYGGCSLTIGDDQHMTMTDHVTVVFAACNYHIYRLSSIRQ